MSPHVLFAAETLAAGVAEVEVGHVASLVYLSVVRLRERPRTPTAIVGLANRPDLKWSVSYKSDKIFSEGTFTFKDFFLLPVFFSYISILRLTANILFSKFVFQSLLSDLLALELILKMEDICELAAPGRWDIVLKERREIEI